MMALMTETLNRTEHRKSEYLQPFKYKSSQILMKQIHLLEERRQMEPVEMVPVVWITEQKTC